LALSIRRARLAVFASVTSSLVFGSSGQPFVPGLNIAHSVVV
jgi:hypothetical protein